MEPYIKGNISDITYLAELIPPSAGLIRPARGGAH